MSRTYTPEQVEHLAERHLQDLDDIEDSPGVRLLVMGLITLAQEGMTRPSVVGELMSTAWYELEVQGYLEPCRGFFGVDDDESAE